MINRLWYEEYGDEGIWAQTYIQQFIDLYCFNSQQYKCPEDITLDNLQFFIEIILKHYQYYHLNRGALLSLGDAFDIYIANSFENEFPNEYPHYSKTDRRELVLHICHSCIQSGMIWHLFPEDVQFVLECLNVPDAEIVSMYDKLNEYFEQFDKDTRYYEEERRWLVINTQRLESIKNNQPLPIRPMGIELDPCYKEGYPKKS